MARINVVAVFLIIKMLLETLFLNLNSHLYLGRYSEISLRKMAYGWKRKKERTKEKIYEISPILTHLSS